MPTFLSARPPAGPDEERTIRKLAGARHAPGGWIRRAKMIVLSWRAAREVVEPEAVLSSR